MDDLDSDFWLDCGERFRLLPEFPTLRLSWVVTPDGNRHKLYGTDPSTVLSFQVIAHRAGQRISPDYNYPPAAWLNAIILKFPNERPEHDNPPDGDPAHESGTIEDVRDASLTLCLMLQRDALLKEHHFRLGYRDLENQRLLVGMDKFAHDVNRHFEEAANRASPVATPPAPMSTNPISDAWRELAETFEGIDDPRGFIRAHWKKHPAGVTWQIECIRDELPGPLATCKACIARAGKLLDPSSVDLTTTWLNELASQELDGGESEGTIRHLVRDSGILCREFESDLLLIEPTKEEDSILFEAREFQTNASLAEVATVQPDATPGGDPVAEERAAALTSFKAKARAQRIKVTDEMIAKAAKPGKWNDRTMVTWWKRNDHRCKPTHDKLIRAVLAKNPASIWPK